MAEGMYSLLGRATTSDYKRRRDEERSYRRALRRDQLKASLLGMVLNPIAQQVSTGISQGISKKFGEQYENWKLNTEDAWQYKRDKKKATENYNSLEKEVEDVKKSGLSLEEYYHQKVAPTFLAENLDVALKQKLNNQLADKNSVYMKGVLPALSRSLYEQGNKDPYDSWAARHIQYNDGLLASPDDLAKYEKAAKDLFPSSFLGTIFKRKKLDDIKKQAAEIEFRNPAITSLRNAQKLQENFKKTNVVDLETWAMYLEEQEMLNDFKKKNVVSREESTIFNQEKKEIEKVTVDTIKIAGGGEYDPEKNEVRTEKKVTRTDKLDTTDKLEEELLKTFRKNGAFLQMYNRLSETGKALYNEYMGGEREASIVVAAAGSNWDGYDEKLDIINEYKNLASILVQRGATSEDFDAEVQKFIMDVGLFDGTVSQLGQFKEKAAKLVQEGTWKTIDEALYNPDSELYEDYQALQKKLVELQNRAYSKGDAFTEAGVESLIETGKLGKKL